MDAVKIFLITLLFSGYSFAKEGDHSMHDSVQSKIILQKSGKSVNALFSDSFKVVGIGLMRGQVLEKHSTPTPAFLFVHEGKVEFKIGEKKYELKAGDYFKIPPKEDHEIVALEDSRLLLAK